MTHFLCVDSPPVPVRHLVKVQRHSITTTLAILNVPADPGAAASMGLHHSVMQLQLHLPFCEGVLASMPPGVSLTATQ
jgi:hypothetical protein